MQEFFGRECRTYLRDDDPTLPVPEEETEALVLTEEDTQPPLTAQR